MFRWRMKTQPDMPPDEEFIQFQQAIWEKLSKRKYLAGRERVMDCISIVVQEWPDEKFALAESVGTTEDRRTVIKDLISNTRRHLHLGYGDHEFGFIWTILLQALVYQLVQLIFEWWKERKNNRMLLLGWQQKWRSQEET